MINKTNVCVCTPMYVFFLFCLAIIHAKFGKEEGEGNLPISWRSMCACICTSK